MTATPSNNFLIINIFFSKNVGFTCFFCIAYFAFATLESFHEYGFTGFSAKAKTGSAGRGTNVAQAGSLYNTSGKVDSDASRVWN